VLSWLYSDIVKDLRASFFLDIMPAIAMHDDHITFGDLCLSPFESMLHSSDNFVLAPLSESHNISSGQYLKMAPIDLIRLASIFSFPNLVRHCMI